MSEVPHRVLGLHVEGTELSVPRWTNTTRPTPSLGQYLFGVNTTTNMAELYNGSEWLTFGNSGMELNDLVTSDTGVGPGVMYPIDTSNNAVRITLPTSPNTGDIVMLFDAKGTWDDNPLTVQSADMINNRPVGNDAIYGMRGGTVEFIYLGNAIGWVEKHRTARADMRVTRWEHLTTTGPHMLEPDVGYTVDSSSLSSPVVVRLPDDETYDGMTVMLVDVGRNLNDAPILVDRNGGKIDGGDDNKYIYTSGSTVELRGFISGPGSETLWYTTVDNASSGLSGWLPNPITGTGSTLAANLPSFIDTSSGTVEAFMPGNPTPGDTVWFVDYRGSFDTNPFILKQAGSGEYIQGLNGDYRFPKRSTSVMLTYSGVPTVGWLITSSHNVMNHAGLQNISHSFSHRPFFAGDIKTVFITVSGNTAIDGVTAMNGQNTTFMIYLKQDSIGGHEVSLPTPANGWYPAMGSQPINDAPDSVSLIQGSVVNGDVYYSVTQYLTS